MTRCAHLVVGGGLAGGRAVDALARRAGPGEVMLVSAEPVLPYQRPVLSKELLLGTLSDEALWLRPAAFYKQRQIELRLGDRAVALDAEGRVVRLVSGEEIAFDRALLCTGAAARKLPLPGADVTGVHRLRELDEAQAIARDLAGARRVVIVGAGFVGCEVAAACRGRGVEVTMLELEPQPCASVLGEEVGAVLADTHRAAGVDVRTSTTARAFEGRERLTAVLTGEGERIPCEVALVGVGAAPRVEWLEASGLELDDGVVVDERLETSAPGIYAAGDIAVWPWAVAGRRLRVEHETNAQTQGMTAARNMLGRPTPYVATPYVWSRQYDLDLWAIGDLGGGWDDVRVERHPRSRSLLAGYLRGGIEIAAAGIDRPDALEPARRRVGSAGTARV